MKRETMKSFILQWIKNNKNEFYEISDFMWDNPELGLEEFKASEMIKNVLKKHGFKIESNIGGMPTSFIAEYGSSQPVIGLNVEYDCLPGLSQKKNSTFIDPIQKGAPGQGCGHNILGPAAVMAGVALRYALEKFNISATIKLFGSPYEESSVGKPVMGKAGAYKDLDCVLDWHPWNYNKADYDRCNSVFIVNYNFEGKTCHGAAPWEGRSALDAGMLFGHSIEILREHLIPNTQEAPNTINYTFTDTGPEFANIIPDTTGIILYGRFHNLEVAKNAFDRVHLCAEGAAIATETKVSRKIITFTHNKLPNKVLSKVVYENLVALGVPEYSDEEEKFVMELQKSAGLEPIGLDLEIKDFGKSESIITDASEYSWNAPYATFYISMGPAGGWHNWMVTACAGNSIGKKCMDRAAEVLSTSAVDIMTYPDILEKAKAEWKIQLNGRTYNSLLPDDYEVPLGINQNTMEKYFGK